MAGLDLYRKLCVLTAQGFLFVILEKLVLAEAGIGNPWFNGTLIFADFTDLVYPLRQRRIEVALRLILKL
jgi:hypothetical protein